MRRAEKPSNSPQICGQSVRKVAEAEPATREESLIQQCILDQQATQLHLAGHTYRQIAQMLHISARGACKRVQRCLKFDRSEFPPDQADVRNECLEFVRQGVGATMDKANAGDLAAFRTLQLHANTMLRVIKIPDTSTRVHARRLRMAYMYRLARQRMPGAVSHSSETMDGVQDKVFTRCSQDS